MRSQRAAAWCIVLSLIGLGVAGYLSALHIGLMRGELLGEVFCGGSGVFNCHAVTASSWGSLLGMPLSLWGAIGYCAALGLSILALQEGQWPAHAMTLLLGLGLLFLAFDLFLLGVMIFVLKAFCLFCMITYLVNFLIVVLAARSLQQPWIQALGRIDASLSALVPSSRRPAAWFFWGIVFIGFGAVASLHAATIYVNRGTFGSLQKQMTEYIQKQVPTPPDTGGRPMKGNPKGALKIVEFSDFLCPVCQRAAKMNQIILTGNRNTVMIVYKHFPLDSTCNEKLSRNVHPGACQVAAATVCAHQQGKFWEFHDKIFEEGHDYKAVNLESDADRLGLDVGKFSACMASGEGMRVVKEDIEEANKLGVTSTPTHFLNGIKLVGLLTPDRFEEFSTAILNTK